VWTQLNNRRVRWKKRDGLASRKIKEPISQSNKIKAKALSVSREKIKRRV